MGDANYQKAGNTFNKEVANFVSGGAGTPYSGSSYGGQGALTRFGLKAIGQEARRNTGGLDAALAANEQMIGGAGPSLTEQTMMDTAMGRNIGANNDLVNALISQTGDNVGAQVNSTFNTSGRFGSGAHVNELARALGQNETNIRYGAMQDDLNRQAAALSAIEGQRQAGIGNQMSAIAQAPGVYNASLSPWNALLAAGQIQDADLQAKATDKLWQFTQRDPYQRDLAHLQGVAGLMGNVKEMPNPLMQALGFGVQTAAAFL